MWTSVQHQGTIFLYTFGGGLLIAFLYDIFRIKRKKLKSGTFITNVEDLIYWVLAVLILFSVIFVSNGGELRGYIFLGIAAGVIFYVLLLSKPIMKMTLVILNILTAFLIRIWKIGIFPFCVGYRIFRVPTKLIFRLVGKSYRKYRRISKVRFSVLIVHKKIFKNFQKKI